MPLLTRYYVALEEYMENICTYVLAILISVRLVFMLYEYAMKFRDKIIYSDGVPLGATKSTCKCKFLEPVTSQRHFLLCFAEVSN